MASVRIAPFTMWNIGSRGEVEYSGEEKHLQDSARYILSCVVSSPKQSIALSALWVAYAKDQKDTPSIRRDLFFAVARSMPLLKSTHPHNVSTVTFCGARSRSRSRSTEKDLRPLLEGQGSTSSPGVSQAWVNDVLYNSKPTTLRCIAPSGVALRETPSFSARTVGMMRSGATFRVVQDSFDAKWVRVVGGWRWLPLVDARGIKICEEVCGREVENWHEELDTSFCDSSVPKVENWHEESTTDDQMGTDQLTMSVDSLTTAIQVEIMEPKRYGMIKATGQIGEILRHDPDDVELSFKVCIDGRDDWFPADAVEETSRYVDTKATACQELRCLPRVEMLVSHDRGYSLAASYSPCPSPRHVRGRKKTIKTMGKYERRYRRMPKAIQRSLASSSSSSSSSSG